MADDLLVRVIAAIERAWDEGSPVAGPAKREELARAAIRRWKSIERRHPRKRPTRDERLEDLAKGLVAVSEKDPRMVGPLMTDYRYLAGRIAAVIDPVG